LTNQCGGILDFQVEDFFEEQQDQLLGVTLFKDQSIIHIIRNGLAVSRVESDPMNVTGITGLWSLKQNTNAKFHSFIVMSFLDETCILEMRSGELGDVTNNSKLITNESTLFCSNTDSEHNIIQITPSSLNLIRLDTNQVVGRWESPGNSIGALHIIHIN
jgi:hypothetical protein